MYTNETKKQWKLKKIIDQRKWSMCSLHSASTATQKKKNINENGSLKWAVAALYVIYGMLNFWSYYKLARLCKTQQKQNSSEYKFFSL